MNDFRELASIGKRVDITLPELQQRLASSSLADEATARQRGQAAITRLIHDARSLEDVIHNFGEQVKADVRRNEFCLSSLEAINAAQRQMRIPQSAVRNAIPKSATKTKLFPVSSNAVTNSVKAPCITSILRSNQPCNNGYSASSFAARLRSDDTSVLRPYNNGDVRGTEGQRSYKSLDELGSGSSWLDEPCVTPEVTCKSIKRAPPPARVPALAVATDDDLPCSAVTSRGQLLAVDSPQSPVLLTRPRNMASTGINGGGGAEISTLSAFRNTVDSGCVALGSSKYSANAASSYTRSEQQQIIARPRSRCDDEAGAVEGGARAAVDSDGEEEVKAVSHDRWQLDTPPTPVLLTRPLNSHLYSSTTTAKSLDGEKEVKAVSHDRWQLDTPPTPVLLTRQLNSHLYSTATAVTKTSESAASNAQKTFAIDDDLKSPILLSRQYAFQPVAMRAETSATGTTASNSAAATAADTSSPPPVMQSRHFDLTTPPSPVLLSKLLSNAPAATVGSFTGSYQTSMNTSNLTLSTAAAATSAYKPADRLTLNFRALNNAANDSNYATSRSSLVTRSNVNVSQFTSSVADGAGRSVLTGATWNARPSMPNTSVNKQHATKPAAPTFSDEENSVRGQGQLLRRKSSRMSSIPVPKTNYSQHGCY